MVVVRILSKRGLLAAVGGVALIAGAPAAAQVPADPIAYCKETSDGKKERIACLEAAIIGLMGGSAQTVQAKGAPASEADKTTDLGAEQVARREQPAPSSTRVADAEDDAERPTGVGAEQVVARQERKTKEGREKRKKRVEAATADARIIDFARTSTGKLILVLDNGQVWAQRTSDRAVVRLRDGEEPQVKIRRGALSGYRMEISQPNVTIVVERLK